MGHDAMLVTGVPLTSVRDGQRHTPDFQASDYPIHRINPAPSVSALTGVHVQDAVLLRLATDLARSQTRDAEAVSDVLFAMAPSVEDAVRRRLVLPLRRCVHNGRSLGEALDPTVLEGLPGYDLVHTWVQRQVRLDAARAEISGAHDDRLHDEREALRSALREETLQRSLAMSSNLLPASAERYSGVPWSAQGKQGRKSEQHLLRYALRAATKTSPFSQYTVVGYPGSDDVTSGIAVASDVTMNLAYLRRVEAALRRTPGAAPRLRVFAAPGLRLVEGRFIVTGERDALGVDAAEIAERYGEAQVSVPASPVAVALLGWLGGQERGEALVSEVVEALVTAVRGLSDDVALRFVHHLQDCGVLGCVGIAREQADDPLGDVGRWVDDALEAGAGEALRPAAAHLRHLQETRRRLAESGAADRVRLLREGGEHAALLLGALGDDVATRPLPVPLWYEDARLVGPPPHAAEPCSPSMTEIAELLAVLQVFDEQHVFMRVLRHRFVRRFGEGGRTDDLDELAALYLPAYDDALQINEGFAHGLLTEDPLLAELVDLRERILAPLRERLAGADVTADLEMPKGLFQAVAAALPAWFRRRPASYAVFLQPRGQQLDDGAVLNKIYNGWGNYVSRFLTRAPGHVTQRVRSSIAPQFPAADRVAEFRPVHGYNANVHPLLTEHEIDVTGRPGPGQIPLQRLDVRHDVEEDRIELVDRDTGTRVHPLYLGFLVPYYLPSRLVPLTAMAGNGSIMFEPQVTADRVPGVDRSQIRAYPRLTWGRTILARRRWIVPSGRIPLPERAETPAEYFVRFNEWRIDAGMPDEMFLHPPAPELQPGQVNDYFTSYLSNRKPQYFAATRRLHCAHLGRLLMEQPGRDVVFEEALPAPADGVEVGDARHCVELVVDFYRTADDQEER